MKVVDHAPPVWFLFEESDTLYFDAACDHGAFGYSWLIELNEDERRRFKEQGRRFLDWLAQDIHNSVPIVERSLSPYKEGNRDRGPGEKVMEAVKAWRSRGTSSR